MLSTLIFLLVLCVLIFVHEWGHFITAKKVGIDVEEFAIGFGPTIWSKKHNGTNYMIKAIPLGGFVRMAGDERDKCKGAPGEFYSASVGARSLVIFNGPLVNFVFAYLCFAAVFMIGYPSVSTKIQQVVVGGPAIKAGLLEGDEIVGINGKTTYGLGNFLFLLEKTKGAVNLDVVRNGEQKTVHVVPNDIVDQDIFAIKRPIRDLGINKTAVSVISDFPAQKAGLIDGDAIVSIDDTLVKTWEEVQNTISGSNNDQISIKVLRNNKLLTKVITPEKIEIIQKGGIKKEVNRIGIAPFQEEKIYRFGFIQSLKHGWDELYYITVMTYKSLYYMVTGKLSPKNMMGPVGIFTVVDAAQKTGIAHLILIMGVISASLAIFNLLPLIPLDGGHLFLLLIEKIRGRILPAKVEDLIMRAGMSFIILLALFVFYNDFARMGFFTKIMQFLQGIGK